MILRFGYIYYKRLSENKRLRNQCRHLMGKWVNVLYWRVSLPKICQEWPNNAVIRKCAHRMSELQRYLVMSLYNYKIIRSFQDHKGKIDWFPVYELINNCAYRERRHEVLNHILHYVLYMRSVSGCYEFLVIVVVVTKYSPTPISKRKMAFGVFLSRYMHIHDIPVYLVNKRAHTHDV